MTETKITLVETTLVLADFTQINTALWQSFQRARLGIISGANSVFLRMTSSSSNENNIPAMKKIHAANEIKDPKQVPDEEWKKVLSTEEYSVTRQAGTEPAFTGKFDKHFKPGKYTCLCCGADLFVSESKYHSGCGWPAFSKSIEGDKNIVRIHDTSYGMERTEVKCRQCDAHLGHVFDDGPKETGERYCINSTSLNFVEVGVKDKTQQ